MDRINVLERCNHDLEEKLYQIEKEKKEFIIKMEIMQKRFKDNLNDLEGLKAENLELKLNLELKSAPSKIERKLSALNLV